MKSINCPCKETVMFLNNIINSHVKSVVSNTVGSILSVPYIIVSSVK